MHDSEFMRCALLLARRGLGAVEPNPLVGCVIVQPGHGAGHGTMPGHETFAGQTGEIVGEGWHAVYGEAHAEVVALAAAGNRARGGTMYVTLEPCCHTGKTPPCTQAIINAGIERVFTAMRDRFPQVDGGGVQALEAAGIIVEAGLLENEARQFNAPYLKLLSTGRPWVIAKWAMTCDGKIATASGDSRWISSAASRALVHHWRSRVDAVVIGRRTAELDDPLLTAREAGPRIATRIVLDTHAGLRLDSQLVQTIDQAPVLVAVGIQADELRCERLRNAGCEVLRCAGESSTDRLHSLLNELGRRRMTNVLVEGGGKLVGSLLDAGEIDEVRTFIAPKLLGGHDAPSPVGGHGVERMSAGHQLDWTSIEQIENDILLIGRLKNR